jgi:hypothetical protein
VPREKRTPNEIGSAAEERARKIIGGRRVKQSGGGTFLKLDVSDNNGFVYSIKSTTKIKDTALRAISVLWREAIQGTRGFMGHGNDTKPAMIFEMPDGELLVLCRLEDHANLAKGEISTYIPLTKAEERRRKAGRL